MSASLAVITKEVAVELFKETASKFFYRYWDAKRAEAVTELLEAARTGKVDMICQPLENDTVHAIWKYMVAAQQGAARRNLRLMAQAIVSLVTAQQTFADDFDRYLPILSRLSREQIVVLVRFVKKFDEHPT